MPLIFDVDGKTLKDPTPDDIARGFASIDAVGTYDLSIIELERQPVTLCAFGNPKQGYTLDIREAVEPKGTETSKFSSSAKPIPQEEVIRAFRAFARGEDSWQGDFQWVPGVGRLSRTTALKRLAAIIGSFVLLVLILKYVVKVL